jgi:hypothetical protein
MTEEPERDIRPLDDADIDSLLAEPVVQDMIAKNGEPNWPGAVKELLRDEQGTGIGYTIPLGSEGVQLAFVRSSDAPDTALIVNSRSGEVTIQTPEGGTIGSVLTTEDGVAVVEGDADFPENG